MMRILSEMLLFITGSPELMLLLKTTIILALGLSLVSTARSARASVRHLLLSCTFAGVLVLPLAAKIAPALKLEINEPTAAATTGQAVKSDKVQPDQATTIAASSSNSSSTKNTSFLSSTRSILWL